MLSVPWFLGWALRPYIQVNPSATRVTITSDDTAVPADDSSNSRLRAKAQVAQLTSPSAARHVTSSRNTSPTSPTQKTASAGPYPVTTQPVLAKTNSQQSRSAPPPPSPTALAKTDSQQTRSAPPPPSPTALSKTTAARTAAAPSTLPKLSSAQTASPTPKGQQGPGTLVSTKTITLKLSAEWAQQQLEQFRFSFDEADRDKNGSLSFDEVQQVITKHGFKGSKQQAKELFAQLDTNNDQKLTRQEFSVALDRLPRNTIKEFALRKTFQRMDKDGSGKLSRKEIEDAAKTEGGLDVPADKIAQLLIVLSKDTKDSAVDYEKFLQVFGVHCTGDVLQEVFHKLDTDHSGYLTKQEILAAIQTEHELKLRAAKISDLLIAWVKDDDQKINYREFIEVWTKYKN